MEMERLDQSIRAVQNKPRRAPGKLTRGAKFIAGYVLLGSITPWQWMPAARTEGHLSLAFALGVATAVTGLIGSILLFRRDRRAKHAFLLWTACVITGNAIGAGTGPDPQPLGFRILTGALIGGIFLLINREVDRNVGDESED